MNYREQVILNLAEGQRVVPAEWVVIKGSRAAAEKAERATRQQPPAAYGAADGNLWFALPAQLRGPRS